MTVKINFTQSGGYVGTIRGCEFDTSKVPPNLKAELERLLEQSGLSASQTALDDKARDLQQYDLTIENGARKTQLTFDDATLPEGAKPLIGFLKKHARPLT